MKLRSIIVITLVLSFLIAGVASAQVTITYSRGQDVTGTIDALIQVFEAENPDIKVEYIPLPRVPNQQYDRYVTLFSAQDSSIDVIDIDIIWVPQFAAAGWIEPIGDKLSHDFIQTLLPGPLAANTYQGEIYGIPRITDAGIFVYHKDLLDKYGFAPPETWEEVIAQSQAILAGENSPTLAGLLFQAAQIEGITLNYLEFLHGTGATFLDDAGNYVLESQYKAEGLQALQAMYDLIYKENVASRSVVTANPEDNRIVFQEGNAIFMRNWPYVWSLLQSEDSPVKGQVGITRIPYFAGNEGVNTSNLGGWQSAINTNSKNKEAALRFAQFLSSYDSQVRYAIEAGALPVVTDVYKNPAVLEKNPHLADLQSALLNAFPRPVTEFYPRLSSQMQVRLNGALTNVTSVERAYEQMLNDINSIMGRR